MKHVVIAAVNALTPGSHWERSLSELAMDAAAPIVSEFAVDAVFAAGAAPSVTQGQSDFAAIVADRLGLHGRLSLTLDAADVSGAAALHAAWVHIRSGICNSALVVAAAKVSDLSEADRLGLMDRTLDQEAEVGLGLTFASQAGLLAGRYCATRELRPEIFSDIAAANFSAWARHNGGAAASSLELRHDLVVAPPLVRNDFAQLLDGACAVLLVGTDEQRSPALESVATSSDVISLWERREPLAFRAVRDAAASAMGGGSIPDWIELDTAGSVVQRLCQDALAIGDGSSNVTINLAGGSHGRGRVPGASPLYQMADVVNLKAHAPRVLAVSVAGLASRAYAAHVLLGDAA